MEKKREISVAEQGASSLLSQARDLLFNVYYNPGEPENIESIPDPNIREALYEINRVILRLNRR